MITTLRKAYRVFGFSGAPEGTLRYRLNSLARRCVGSQRLNGQTKGLVANSVTIERPTWVTDHRRLGMRDATTAGWFCNDTRELCPGYRIDPADIVIDVGCGGAGNARFCASICDQIIVADIDPERVAAAERTVRKEPVRSVTAVVTDANPLPIDDETATKVISTEVIEHVDDPVQFLSELVRVGKHGSQYLLSVPDPVAEGVQKRIAPDSSFRKPNHIRIIGRDEFTQLVTGAGLVVESRASYGFFWAMYHSLFWPCHVDFETPQHPLLDNWCATWNALLDLPQGRDIMKALDAAMPKSQVIIARKP